MISNAFPSPASRRFLIAAVALPLLAVATIGALEAFMYPSAQALPEPPALRLGFGPKTYLQAVSHADEAVLLGRERVAYASEEWLRRESFALGLYRRAQLTGNFDDLAAALFETREAMELAPARSGPMLTWATIAMSAHLLAEAESALAKLDGVAVLPAPPEASEIAALRGDLAFYRGDLRSAALAYAKSGELDQSPGIAIRRARLAKARADYDTARAWFVTALREAEKPTPQLAAQIELQLGGLELARGRYAAAQLRFEAADRVFPGHWLVQAHLAQAKALDGNLGTAIADMRVLAQRTDHPDAIDALALMLRADGRLAESRDWARRAGAIWAKQLQTLPEAALGHAIEHELAFGSPDRAVALARRNVAARPYGEAHLLLAQALMQAGSFEPALMEVERARAAGWRSASLFALESNLLTVLGRAAQAAQSRKEAVMLNPRIFENEIALIWFSHG